MIYYLRIFLSGGWTMKNDILNAIEREKIILVLRAYSGEKLFRIVDACIEGGIRVIETPFSTDKTETDEENCDKIRELKARYGDRICIGAGTVLDENQVKMAAKAGAQFIVSPISDEKVIEATKKAGLVSVSGAMTPTEAYKAYKAGADFVKLFPIEQIGGPAYIKALRAPFPQIKFIAFGGVKIDDAAKYIEAGADGIGIASEILNHEMIENGDFEGVKRLAQKCVTAVSSCLNKN